MFAVEHQRLPGIDRQRRRAGDAHRLDGRQADHRHVEAHVLVRLRHLDDADTGPGQMTGAANHLVGAFHRFDGHDRLVLDGDGLADVERGNRVRHPVAELEVGAFPLVGRAIAEHALAGEQRRQEHRRVEQLDPLVFHDVRHRGDQRIGVPRLEAPEHRQQRQVRDDAGEDLDMTHLPRHHRLRHAGGLEELDALAELSEGDPVEGGVGLPRRGLEVGERFFLDGDDRDLVAEVTGALQCEERKFAVAGDDADACH